ncbi:MAG: hypothetical protein GY679_05180 [Mycoplasma sp.]|nr:hypothetical protein [Mycoplasma sp.]
MVKNKFVKMTKEEKAETYGGFAVLSLLNTAALLIQTLVGSAIAIYQVVKHKTGSVSFGGSKTITNKEIKASHSSTKKTHSSSPSFFTAF